VAATATTGVPALSVTATGVDAGGSVLLASTNQAAGSTYKLIHVRLALIMYLYLFNVDLLSI
jgi:hypothetical protein